MAVKRTRPKAAAERPVRTVVAPQLNAPHPGCCKPYPDATFKSETLVKLLAHHNGSRCKGYLEPMDVEAWYAEIDNRSRAGGDDG